MDECWYAVQTKPRQERQVSRWLLRRCQLQVFLPKLAVQKRRRRRRITAIEILFPSYLFVRTVLDPAAWYAVKWTPGVKGVVGMGDVPVPIPEEAIQFLMQRCVDGDVIPWQPALPVGAQVRVREGPMAGLVGILERPAAQRERVRVLLNLMGRQTPVELDSIDLEQVS